MFCWMVWILGRSWDPSFTVTEQAMTALETPQALPSATTRYGKSYDIVFLSNSRQTSILTFWEERNWMKKIILKKTNDNSIPCFDLTNT